MPKTAIGKPAPLDEAALYAPVKRFFESRGFTVKGEVNGCDLVARRGDEPPLIVELKLRFTLPLVLVYAHACVVSVQDGPDAPVEVRLNCG